MCRCVYVWCTNDIIFAFFAYQRLYALVFKFRQRRNKRHAHGYMDIQKLQMLKTQNWDSNSEIQSWRVDWRPEYSAEMMLATETTKRSIFGIIFFTVSHISVRNGINPTKSWEMPNNMRIITYIERHRIHHVRVCVFVRFVLVISEYFNIESGTMVYRFYRMYAIESAVAAAETTTITTTTAIFRPIENYTLCVCVCMVRLVYGATWNYMPCDKANDSVFIILHARYVWVCMNRISRVQRFTWSDKLMHRW